MTLVIFFGGWAVFGEENAPLLHLLSLRSAPSQPPSCGGPKWCCKSIFVDSDNLAVADIIIQSCSNSLSPHHAVHTSPNLALFHTPVHPPHSSRSRLLQCQCGLLSFSEFQKLGPLCRQTPNLVSSKFRLDLNP